MGAAQPPTSAPAPAALSISPGPGWDWTYFMGDQTRSSAGATQAGGKAGTRARAAVGLHPSPPPCLPPREVIGQTCICSKGISKLKDSLK